MNSRKMSSKSKAAKLDAAMWYASRAYIRQYGFVAAHIASYNTAVTESIPSIIESTGSFTLVDDEDRSHRVTFSNTTYDTNPMHREENEDITILTPKMCMDRNISYLTSIYADITYEGPDGQVNVYAKKHIGGMPIMARSVLCTLSRIAQDEVKIASLHEDVLGVGGYFVTKGAAKVLVHQVRPAHNLIHTYKGKSNTKGVKFSMYAETRSGSPNSHTATVQVGIMAKSGLLYATVAWIEMQPIPLGVMFRAMGVTSEQDMVRHVFPVDWMNAPPTPAHADMVLILVKSLEQSYRCDSQEVALDYIGRRCKKFTEDADGVSTRNTLADATYLLTNEFLPHIKYEDSDELTIMQQKCAFVGYMTQKVLMSHVGLSPNGDRDHFANKRLSASGPLISTQFYNAFKQLIHRVKLGMKKDISSKIPVNVSSYIASPYVVTTSMIGAISSNKWTRGQTDGISQALDNFNRSALICFLRKFVIPIAADGGKIEAPRRVHMSQWGVSCMYATPEGKKVGLSQGLSMGSYISTGCDEEPVIQMLEDMDIKTFHEEELNFLVGTRVFVNGAPYGCTMFPLEIAEQLRELRRTGCINLEVSIAHDPVDNEIRISTDSGRFGRALAIAPEGVLRLTTKILKEVKAGKWDGGDSSAWIHLLERGYVEIIFKDEEEYANVAIYPSDFDKMSDLVRMKYTHCELTPDMIEGAGVSTSPHNHRNQAPRNIYQEAMSHQAIGVQANSQYGRRGKWHVLDYPQEPIVSTRIGRELFGGMPMGQNAMIAVMPWYGLNQEDSLVLHKDAIERGFMNTTTFIAFEATIKLISVPGAARYEMFEIPSAEVCNDYKGFAGKLKMEDGYAFVPRGTSVQNNDILIGVTVSGAHENSIFSKNKTNISVRYDQMWPGTVHSVQTGTNGEGYKYIRVVVAQPRKPVKGDKFAARHGQKGTAGDIRPTNQMPFLKNRGYTPDILVNPAAFPSRMTIGMLAEALTGSALTGCAMQMPEFHQPLCLDEDRDGCTTKNDYKKKWQKKAFYVDGFDPETGYDDISDLDGTPWDTNFSVSRVLEAMKKMGLDEFAEEIVINPITGQELPCLIFNSVVYYQRLKHMVVDKVHARPRGNIHALHRQPTEGRKNGGGFRIGHMERDCMAKRTSVALREGISVPIEQLTRNEQVWGWDEDNSGLTSSAQTNYAAKGVLPRFDITLQDGRKIGATKNHPLLTESGEWSDLKDLVVGEKLTCTANYAFVDFEKDMESMKGWRHDTFFTTTSHNALRKNMCLARIVGLVTTDGYTPETGKIHAFLGHQLDVEAFLDDVERLTKVRPKCAMNKNTYEVLLPTKLSNLIRDMGVLHGAKVGQPFTLPSFIDETTPMPIIREFLGGMFGGDGHTVCLSTRREKMFMKSVAISWTKDPANLESLIEGMGTIQDLLRRCGVNDATIQTPKLTTNSKQSNGTKSHKEVVLNIPLEQLINFAENVGFRYCVHKSQRLDAGVSYRRFREGVLRQRSEICEAVDAAVNYRDTHARAVTGKKTVIRTKKPIEEAVADLLAREPLLHAESVPSGKMLGRILLEKNANEIRSATFPTVDEYFTEIGVMDLFDDYGVTREQTVLPHYALRIIDVRANGEDEMYDITVAKAESFVANGVVSHNCMLGQGLAYMTTDRLFHQSDAYRIPVCTICGLQAVDNGETMECRVCNTTKCVMVPIPFGTKLLNQEFSAANIVPRLITNK